MDELLTVQQVAEHLKISRQAVYKKIDNEFKPYLHIVNGKKYLDKRAIGIFDEKYDNQEFTNLLSKSLQLLTEQNEVLKAQLEQKDKQLEEKDKQISNLQKLIDQSQQLQAIAENKIKLLEQKETPPEPVNGSPSIESKKGFLARLFGR
jgi:chromosome segregation ATPase